MEGVSLASWGPLDGKLYLTFDAKRTHLNEISRRFKQVDDSLFLLPFLFFHKSINPIKLNIRQKIRGSADETEIYSQSTASPYPTVNYPVLYGHCPVEMAYLYSVHKDIYFYPYKDQQKYHYGNIKIYLT